MKKSVILLVAAAAALLASGPAIAGTTPSNFTMTLHNNVDIVSSSSTQTKLYSGSYGSVSTLDLNNSTQYRVRVVRSWGNVACDFSDPYRTGSSQHVPMTCGSSSPVSTAEQVTLYYQGLVVPANPTSVTSSWYSN